MDKINTIGRRKASIARIYLSEGKGKITINKRDFTNYFTVPMHQFVVIQPFKVLDLEKKYDVKVNLKGGGIKGQAEALRLAISKAFVKINEEYKPTLKSNGFITRDSRIVERKKPGRPKARKRFQFSKR